MSERCTCAECRCGSRSIDGVVVRPMSKNVDNRGWLAEIFRSDELDNKLMPVMSYISCTRPGIVRGPHEHTTQTDIFGFVSGKWLVKLWDYRITSDTYGVVLVIKVDKPTVVIVPPGVVHSYSNVGASDGLVINLPNVLYHGYNKQGKIDEIRHENNKIFYPVKDIQRKHWLAKLLFWR